MVQAQIITAIGMVVFTVITVLHATPFQIVGSWRISLGVALFFAAAFGAITWP